MAANVTGTLRRRGFTLIELLITISIIGLMASMVVVATYSAMEQAKEQKTRALISKLDAIIKAKWEAYKTRRIPINTGGDQYDDANGDGSWNSGESLQDLNGNSTYDAPPSPYIARKMRLDALHDLMRMELPDRWTDIYDPPFAMAVYYNTPPPYAVVMARPAVNQSYLRRLKAVPSVGNNLIASWPQDIFENQGAECLYLIVMAALGEEGDAREVFKPGDTGDTDGDGLLEFIDAWGKPIKFARWPAGFTSELQVVGSGPAVTPSGPMGQTFTIEVYVAVPGGPNGNFSSISGAYVDGAVGMQTSGMDTPQIVGNQIARITAYQFFPATGKAIITCSTPTSTTMQEPFKCANPPGAGGPNYQQEIYIFAPDPFDPGLIYPIYPSGTSFPPYPGTPPDTSVPSYATYPLIYSSGPDKEYGIFTNPDTVIGSYFSYTKAGLYPFIFGSLQQQLIGSCSNSALKDETSSTAWRDNIHNHLQGTR